MARDQSKPGIDWPMVRTEVQSGKHTLREVARRHGITHQSIMERRDREGWDARPQHVEREVLPIAIDGQLSEDVLDGVLWALEEGGSEDVVALAIGMSPAEFRSRIDADPAVKLRVLAAIGKNLLEAERRIVAAGKRGAWQSDQFRLRTSPYTSHLYSEKSADSSPKTIISISFDRESHSGTTGARILAAVDGVSQKLDVDPFT